MKASINSVLDIFGTQVRIILFSRHGDKTPENHITTECLLNIIENGMPGLDFRINVLQLGSACARSTETAYAAATWILNHGGQITKYLPTDSKLGSDKLFKELYPDEVKEKMNANGWKNYETLVKANRDGLKRFEKGVSETVWEMFNQMEIGDIALSISHSPTVECIFNYFVDPDRGDEKMAVAPLDGIILIQTDVEKEWNVFALD